MSGKQVLRLGLAALFGAAYLWLGHLASISADPPLVSIIMGLAPLTASAVVLVWHSRSVGLQLLCAACLIGMVLEIDFLRSNTAWVYLIQHAGMHIMLGVMFGRTLSHGYAGALCSRISCFVYPEPLNDAFFRYAWKVTLVWTIYFAAAATVSILLFFFGPREAWSIFANLLTPVLIGAIFVIEYLVRLRALPQRQHISIAQTIRAYREYSQRTTPR
ncbi:MAG: transrane protein [Proteobacteria bacterium]|nr:transrane protein [Pseudomonadota bacterium]